MRKFYFFTVVFILISIVHGFSDKQVYAVGWKMNKEKNQAACYWTDKTCSWLPAGDSHSSTTGISIFNNKIYISGWYQDSSGKINACFWEDGKKKDLFAAGFNAYANAVYVQNNVKYVAGYFIGTEHKEIACYWTIQPDDVEFITLSTNKDPTHARDIVLIKDDIYICGIQYNEKGIPGACYWKNNKIVKLGSEDAESGANSIIIQNNNIIICGYYKPDAENISCYWIDSSDCSFHSLKDEKVSESNAMDICIIKENIFIAGDYKDVYGTRNASLWKNTDTLIKLDSDFSSSWGTSIIYTGDAILTGGYRISQSHNLIAACYWKNNEMVILEEGSVKSKVLDIAVK